MKHLRPFNEENERSFKDIFKDILNWKLINYVLDISTPYTDNDKFVRMMVEVELNRVHHCIYVYHSKVEKYINGDWTETVLQQPFLDRIRLHDKEGALKDAPIRYIISAADRDVTYDLAEKLKNKFPYLEIESGERIFIFQKGH